MRDLPTGAAMVAGVAGQPISHSLSPFVHTAWLRHMGINGVYAPFSPLDDTAFRQLIIMCQTNGIKGFNVTAPFKTLALSLSDKLSDKARQAGSANLLSFGEDEQIYGDSTDGYGLVRAFALQAPDCDLSTGPVVVMGAGGAARAAVAALIALKCPQIRVVNRTLSHAQDLVTTMGSPSVKAFSEADKDLALYGATGLINSTSGGALPDFKRLSQNACVMDMTYRPLKTNWLVAAEALGLRVVDGLSMLIEQARPSFKAFYGQEPDPDFNVRALALAHLGEAPELIYQNDP
jgi:shikimate dehydrogenase